MYQIGDIVVYGVHGVCKIVELQTQRVDRKKVEYFVLEPVFQMTSRFFVPSQNEVALSKLRPVLSREEIEALLVSEESHKACWIEDENLRKLEYKNLIANGDRGGLLSMLKVLNTHKANQAELGKKFHISDSSFMRDAEKMIYSEFSLVLDIPYEQVEAYIQKF